MSAPQIEPHAEEHGSFIKTPKQLIVVVVLAFAVPVFIIVLLAKLVVSGDKFDASHPAMTDEAIAQRIKPVGKVVLNDTKGAGGPVMAAAAAPAAPAAPKSGEEVYKTVCAACHSTGALNAPKTGDKAAWSKLLGEGLDHLTEIAIAGIRQMPARGGNPNLSDLEVKRAVAYLGRQAGADWPEPAAPAAAGAPPQATEAVTAAAPLEQPAAAVQGKPGTPTPEPDKPAGQVGKNIYDSVCAACHVAAVAGAPKTGDKAAWAPRIAQGMDALYASVMKGKGAMPPKGGAMQYSEEQIKEAVDYLVGLAK